LVIRTKTRHLAKNRFRPRGVAAIAIKCGSKATDASPARNIHFFPHFKTQFER
jgi:hypothetical protein